MASIQLNSSDLVLLQVLVERTIKSYDGYADNKDYAILGKLICMREELMQEESAD